VKRPAAVAVAVVALAGTALAQQPPQSELDPVLRAMVREIDRSQALRLVGLDAPYFIAYGLEDAASFSVTATLGAIVSRRDERFRVPRVEVRVGSYDFDNTNYVFTDYFSAGATRGAQPPLDNNELAIRTFLWLTTDRSYKGAVAAIARKRAALKNVTVHDDLPDFWKAEPVRMITDPVNTRIDESAWISRVRRLSNLLSGYPKIINSSVRFESIRSNSYLVNSEGTAIRYPDTLHYVVVRAEAQAPDGMRVRDAAVVPRLEIERMPSEVELERLIQRLAGDVSALAEAPAAESYAGPVLFEGQAAPQMFAQLLGGNLAVPRRPVAEPGRTVPFQPSELDGRIGARILPEWMDAVDDPTQRVWHGRPLLGHYLVDMEGVEPQPLPVVQKGVLKAYLLTRQPVKGQSGSNGRARLPGRFGAKAASISNLFIRAEETVTPAALRRRLLELCSRRGKPYGLIIRKLDFPCSASLAELRRMSTKARESGGGRLFSNPILAYRVYPDGKEELVRGLRFRSVSVRALRDILAASDEAQVFHFMGNTAPLSLIGAGGFVTTCSVIAPPVLIEDMELDHEVEDLPTPPVVPPPELAAPR